MRASREQFAENRQRILEVAGRLFRQKGFEGIGVDGIMDAAGLTHGGFYGHFDSKAHLAEQACSFGLEQTKRRWETLARDSPQRLPNAQLSLYPDSGHGGLFQHGETFVDKGIRFLHE